MASEQQVEVVEVVPEAPALVEQAADTVENAEAAQPVQVLQPAVPAGPAEMAELEAPAMIGERVFTPEAIALTVKSLRDNFKGWSSDEIDMIEDSKGWTLRYTMQDYMEMYILFAVTF